MMTILDLSKIYAGRCVLNISSPNSICLDCKLNEVPDGETLAVSRIVPGHNFDSNYVGYGDFIEVFAEVIDYYYD